MPVQPTVRRSVLRYATTGISDATWKRGAYIYSNPQPLISSTSPPPESPLSLRRPSVAKNSAGGELANGMPEAIGAQVPQFQRLVFSGRALCGLHPTWPSRHGVATGPLRGERSWAWKESNLRLA